MIKKASIILTLIPSLLGTTSLMAGGGDDFPLDPNNEGASTAHHRSEPSFAGQNDSEPEGTATATATVTPSSIQTVMTSNPVVALPTVDSESKEETHPDSSPTSAKSAPSVQEVTEDKVSPERKLSKKESKKKHSDKFVSDFSGVISGIASLNSRWSKKLGHHEDREAERQKNFKLYGLYKKDSKIEKMIAAGKLTRKENNL